MMNDDIVTTVAVYVNGSCMNVTFLTWIGRHACCDAVTDLSERRVDGADRHFRIALFPSLYKAYRQRGDNNLKRDTVT